MKHDLSTRFETLEVAPKYLPERSLLAAIITRAICDVLGSNNTDESPKSHKDDAINWMRLYAPIVDKDFHTDWSFAWICMLLDMNAFTIKRVVLKMLKEGQKFYSCPFQRVSAHYTIP